MVRDNGGGTVSRSWLSGKSRRCVAAARVSLRWWLMAVLGLWVAKGETTVAVQEWLLGLKG